MVLKLDCSQLCDPVDGTLPRCGEGASRASWAAPPTTELPRGTLGEERPVGLVEERLQPLAGRGADRDSASGPRQRGGELGLDPIRLVPHQDARLGEQPEVV